jgi:hypothetical protein
VDHEAELRDPAKFEEVVGHPPVALPDIQSDLVPAAGEATDVGAAAR